MCTHDLPDMYALSLWACGPWALGIHIRQIPLAHVITITRVKKQASSLKQVLAIVASVSIKRKSTAPT